MKPTVLIDMDGPLANFDLHYWNAATELWDRSGPDYDQTCWNIDRLEDQQHRFLSNHIADSRVASAMRRVVNSEGWFAALPPVEGAADAMNELAEVADVWVCSKPLEANPTCRDEKAAWLARHIGSGWETRLILAPDKSMVRGRLLLDDAIKPHWVPKAEWKPVVFDAPFNREGMYAGIGKRSGLDTAPWERFTWADGIDRLIELAKTPYYPFVLGER